MVQGFQNSELAHGQIRKLRVVRQPVFQSVGSTGKLDESIEGQDGARITLVMCWYKKSPYQIFQYKNNIRLEKLCQEAICIISEEL